MSAFYQKKSEKNCNINLKRFSRHLGSTEKKKNILIVDAKIQRCVTAVNIKRRVTKIDSIASMFRLAYDNIFLFNFVVY